jgi:hypothetical protein
LLLNYFYIYTILKAQVSTIVPRHHFTNNPSQLFQINPPHDYRWPNGGPARARRSRVRLSATVTPKFSPYITFSPYLPPYFSSPAAIPPKYSPYTHYHYKISFSIPTINFLSTNKYSWTHNTVFRVMNSDTLDLGGERRGPTRRGAVGGPAAAIGCPLQPTCKGRGGGSVERCT